MRVLRAFVCSVPIRPRSIQMGLHAAGNDWVSLHRNYDPGETSRHDQVTVGTSELPMRNQYRAWAHYMTATM